MSRTIDESTGDLMAINNVVVKATRREIGAAHEVHSMNRRGGNIAAAGP